MSLRPIVAAIALAACDGAPDVTEVRFVDVESPASGGALVVREESVADARAHLLDALDDAEDTPAVLGGDAWRTRVTVRGGSDVSEAVREGRTYALRGESDLRLEVRLGAGDRGALSGGTVSTGAERAMVQVALEDPGQVSARFRVSIVADDGAGGAHPREVTPSHLTRPVPRGTYRAWVDVPARGGRYLVGIIVLGASGEPVAYAWSSPIAVVRPWL